MLVNSIDEIMTEKAKHLGSDQGLSVSPTSESWVAFEVSTVENDKNKIIVTILTSIKDPTQM